MVVSHREYAFLIKISFRPQRTFAKSRSEFAVPGLKTGDVLVERELIRSSGL